MEIRITRKTEDNRCVSQITIPDELWGYAHIRRNLMEDLESAGFHFQDPKQELRVQRPHITLFSWGPSMSLIMAEQATCAGVERALEWITKEKVELNFSSGYPWEEGEYSIPIPLKEVPV